MEKLMSVADIEAVKIYCNEQDWRDGMYHYLEALDKAITLNRKGELKEKPVLELTRKQVQALLPCFPWRTCCYRN